MNMKRGILATVTATGSGGGIPVPAIWNVADKSPNIVLSGGGLIVESVMGGIWSSIRATVGKSGGGKYIWEDTTNGPGQDRLSGIMTAAAGVVDAYVGADQYGFGYYGAGFLFNGGNFVSYGGAQGGGKVVTTLLNLDAMELRFKLDGTLFPVIDISSLVAQVIFPALTHFNNYALASTATNFGPDFLHPEAGYIGVAS